MSTTLLAIGLVITFGIRFVLLMVFLRTMIHFQKMNFTWLPLIGAAFLAAAFDMVPLVGHYLAVPVLYLCIWKITNCDLFPDAVFTVGLSYALTFMVTLILLAYAPVPGLHTASTRDNFDDATNAPAVAVVQPANPTADTPAAPDSPDSKIAAGISIAGVSGLGNSAIVTIQYGRKNYSLSADEGITLSTDEGIASVHLLGADEKEVQLAVGSQTVKYPVK
jgi:hypothetical protein